MKKLLLLLVTVALLASFAAGCGEEDPTKPPPTDKTTLTLWETEKPILDLAIMDYEMANPDVTVVVEAVPASSPNLLTTLKMAIGAGTAPDMLNTPSDYVWSLGQLGFVKDLTAYGAADVKDLFTENTWKYANSAAGKIYSLPFDSNIINFVYNKDLLDAIGVTAPETLADMKNVGDKLQAKYGTDSNKYAYCGPYEAETYSYIAWGTFHYYWYLWRMGGDIFNADYTECIINSPEAVEALQLLADFKNDGYVVPADAAAEFWAGNVAMMNDVTIWIYEGLKATTSNIQFGMMPTLKEGVDPYTGLGLYCYCVVDDCKNPQAAYDFLEFLCTDVDYQIDYCKPLYFIPSLKEALESSYFKTADWKIILEQSKYAKATPGVENWQEMDEAIYRAMEAVFAGQTSAQEALNVAKTTIDGLLKK